MKAKRAGRVRMIFIWNANEEGQRLILTLIQVMFKEPADKWEPKTGIIIPLHKKRDQANSGNFRGVFLLSTASQILAKVLTTRLRNWSEKHGVIVDNQDGFRRGRSTADTTQIAKRLHENNRRVTKKTRASLQDLTKTYPRLNCPQIWKVLEPYGFEGKFTERLKDLHKVTEYKVRAGKELRT